MKCNVHLQNLVNKAGIQRIYKPAKRYMPTTVLCEANGCDITVSDVLEQIEYTVRFIKGNFNVDQQKYKETLDFLRMCKRIFQNESSGKPRKSMAHSTVEVIHEIQDMHAQNKIMKAENENIAITLDLLIDMFVIN